jgi:hypothetical protein
MSRKKKTRIVEETYYEIKCDFCDSKLESQWDNVRVEIEKCDVCGRDFCNEHGKLYYDNSIVYCDSYYPELCICKDCVPTVDPLWEKGQETLKRYEPLGQTILRQIKEGKDEVDQTLD